MKNESPKSTPAVPAASTLNPPARRRVRRQFDPVHPIQPLPSILLGHENPEAFHFVREAVNQEFTPQTNYQQILSELASQNLWRTLRTGAVEAAASDIQVADQAQHVDRTYEEIDTNCRVALTLRDQVYAQTKRLLKHDESDYTRRHFLIVKHLERARKRA